MQLKTVQKLELPAAADMHVHLRQGEMMDVVVPTLEQGGVDTAFVYVIPGPMVMSGRSGRYRCS